MLRKNQSHEKLEVEYTAGMYNCVKRPPDGKEIVMFRKWGEKTAMTEAYERGA